MTQPTKADGARALSIEENEVEAVADSPAGLIVVTTDGVRYIVVDEDNPDAAGRCGVMFLVPPKLPYHGTFPVYSQPGIPAEDLVEPVDPDERVPDVSQRELLAWVGEDIDRATAALEVEQAKEKPRPGFVDALGKRMAEIADNAAAGAPPLS